MSTPTTVADIRDVISRGKMTRAQAAAVLVAIFLNTVDGYDVLVMAFASSKVANEFGLAPEALGFLLSAGLFGMAIGSILIAPLADRIGRRPITLGALLVVTVFMALSAMAPSAEILGLLRLATGIGIGAMLPNLFVFSSEFATEKWREPAVVMNAVAYALGGTLGGFQAAWLMAQFGWRAAFWLGSGLGLLALILAWLFVPESVLYLIERRPANALTRVNAVLAKIRRPAIAELPEREAHQQVRVADMFRGSLGRTTILAWIGFFGLMAGFYFANSWTPRLLNQSGLSEQLSVIGGVLISAGGIVGCLLLAVLTLKVQAKFLEVAVLLGSAVALVLFTFVMTQALGALVGAVIVGFFINASVAGMYAVVSTRYPPQIRSTGVGWGVGMGRLGSILAPMLAGALLGAGMGPKELYFVFAVPMVIAAIAIALIGKPYVAPSKAVSQPVEAVSEARES